MRIVGPAAAVSVLLSIAALLAWSLPASSAESELVQNGAFDSGIAGWTVSGVGALSWSTEDVLGRPSSGSLSLKNAASLPENTWAEQCRTLSPAATTVTLKASVKSASPATDSIAFAQASFWTGPNCTGDFISSVGNSDAEGPAWTSFTATSAIPTGAASVSIQLGLNKFGTADAVVANFDDISLVSDAAAAIPAQRVVLPALARD